MCLVGDPIFSSYSNAYCWLPLVICDKKELAGFQIAIKRKMEMVRWSRITFDLL